MKVAFVSLAVLACFFLAPSLITAITAQPPPPPGGGKVEPSPGPRPPEGVLGVALGEYVTIEGIAADRGKVGTRTLLVEKVNGKQPPKPIALWVHNLDLPRNERCVLKGYETGEMIGTPPAVFAAAKEMGKKDVGVGQAGWQWRPHFVVLIVSAPKGLKLPEEP